MSFLNITTLKAKVYLKELNNNSIYPLKSFDNSTIDDCFALVGYPLEINILCQENYLNTNSREFFEEKSSSENLIYLLPNGLTPEEDERERIFYNYILMSLFLIVVSYALIMMFCYPSCHLESDGYDVYAKKDRVS